MSEGVIAAVINASTGVLVALIGGVFGIVHVRRQKRRDAVISQKVEVVREQVQNSHGTNLRDDLDLNHAAIMSEISGIRRDIGRGDSRAIELGKDIRDLRQKLDKHLDWSAEWSDKQERADVDAESRIEALETTLNPKEK